MFKILPSDLVVEDKVFGNNLHHQSSEELVILRRKVLLTVIIEPQHKLTSYTLQSANKIRSKSLYRQLMVMHPSCAFDKVQPDLKKLEGFSGLVLSSNHYFVSYYIGRTQKINF